jgi:thiol-disulfide isomerase/thioredoxin
MRSLAVMVMFCAIVIALNAPNARSRQAQTAGPTPATKAAPGSPPPAKPDSAAETALQKALATAGSDRAALVRNLEQYLLQYPDAPRKAGVYRALVEACQQLQDPDCALNYAERLVAIQPDDSDMMLVAVDYLQRKGDDASLTRAAGYLTRVIDRVEKAGPEQRAPRQSAGDWQQQHTNLRTALYFVRGQVENSQHDYDAAKKDLQTSYAIQPNSAAAEMLGEIAELKNDPGKAIEEYTLAFDLQDTGPARVDRREVRQKLGNVWRSVHGSEQGLGEEILAAYDRLAAPAVSASPSAANKSAKDTFSFILRRPDGTPLALSTMKGKIVVLSFWATWCGPCQELEPMLIQTEKAYSGNPNVLFLAVNTDEDETQVTPFLQRVKWDIPTAFADGLDDFLGVGSLPTVIVLDREGKIVYRVAGLDLNKFSTSLNTALQNAAGGH